MTQPSRGVRRRDSRLSKPPDGQYGVKLAVGAGVNRPSLELASTTDKACGLGQAPSLL